MKTIYDKNLFAYEKLQRLEKVLSPDNGSNNILRILQELRAQLLGIITSQTEGLRCKKSNACIGYASYVIRINIHGQ
jgi:hypothetical protein